ncbi:MAG: SLBB domain-containing protein [Nitrospirota bacterium]|nr:MAG: SLBB domain-containing protein [Nitrospirota bacterium]
MRFTFIFKYSIIMFVLYLALSPLYLFAAENYIVGEGDVLKITVYEHPDLETRARVSGDDTLKMPLIGNVSVSGLTVSMISEKITSLLADGYIVKPHVSVFVEEFRSRKATILGQVNKPGIYVLSGNTTLLELLSNAGGLTKDAGEKAIIKRERSSDEKEILTIDLKRLVEDGETSLDVALMDKDNIFISKAGVYFITGEVRDPDSYKHEQGTTVIKAVAKAGGFTDTAALKKIRIIRKVDGKEKVIEKVKMDEPVLPDDVIIVPESFF